MNVAKTMTRSLWGLLLAATVASSPVRAGAATHAGRDISLSTSAAECGACHPWEFQQWRYGAGSDLDSGASGSYHALSSTDAMFRGMIDGIASETQPYCRGCHEPANPWSVQDQVNDIPAPRTFALEEGVSCVSCHFDGTTMVSGRALERPLFCATCHNDSAGLVEVYAEWSTEYRGGRTCQQCHMRKGDHAFPGFHSPSMARRALAIGKPVANGRIAPGVPFTFQFTVANVGTGHSVPEDLLRVLSTRATLLDGSGAEQYECVNTYYKRHAMFGENRADTQVIGAGASVVVECPSAVAPAPGVYTIRVDVRQGANRFDPAGSTSVLMGSSDATLVIR